MNWRLELILVSLATMLAGAAVLQGASPDLSAINPRGAQRGAEAALYFEGARLADARQILFYSPGFDVIALEAAGDSRVDAKIQIAPDCRLGEHAMRLVTNSGISQLRTFWVGQFPVVGETEPNNDFDHPQKIDLNVTVAGVVTNEDVDYYLVEAKQGQRISAEIEGIRLGLTLFDPYVAIQDMARFELSASDDTALALQDSVAAIVVPQDGAYVIQVRESAYGGNGNCRYRLHVGTFPRPRVVYPPGGQIGEQLELRFIGDVAGDFTQSLTLPDHTESRWGFFAQQEEWLSPSPNRFRVSDFAHVLEAEPNNGRDQATPTEAPLPLAFNGIIETAGDVDWFRFPGKKGNRYNVRVHARSVRSPLDSVLTLHNADGKQLAANDDAGGPDSAFDFTLPDDGEYLIRIRDHLGQGGPYYVYRVEFTPIRPQLALQIPRFGRDSQARQVIPIPKGNRYATLIRAGRNNFGGELVIEAPRLPEGVTLGVETLPANIDVFPIVFKAAADAPLAGEIIDLIARHADANQSIRGGFQHTVELVLGPPNNTVYYAHKIDKLALAVTEEAPFTLEIEEPQVELVQNGSMNLKVIAQRKEGFDGSITVRMLWNPPGVGAKTTVTIDKGQTEVLYPINANGGAQPATWKIVVLGEADAGHGQVLVSSGLTSLTVAEPYVTMKIAMAALEQGQIGEIVCALEQKRPFDGKAKVTLIGLPAKVATVEKEISQEDTELVFDIKTEADSPPGKHKALFCRLIVIKNNVPILHNVGHGGVLRIDKPPPPKKDEPTPPAEPKPAPEPEEPKKKPEKRLTRLEKLRLQAQQRAQTQQQQH